MKAFLHHYRVSSTDHHKRYTCQRTAKIIILLENVQLFKLSEGVIQLTNIFNSTPIQLDTSCINDLLSFQTVGENRLFTYLKQYVLPTADPASRPKRRKRLRKLATFSSRPTPAHEQKCRVNELENIARNAMQILQKHGISEQTSPFPQALADIHGNMRVSKKK